jgi:hypothetical protein
MALSLTTFDPYTSSQHTIRHHRVESALTVARAVYTGADEASNPATPQTPSTGFVAKRGSQRNLTKLLGLRVPWQITILAAAGKAVRLREDWQA